MPGATLSTETNATVNESASITADMRASGAHLPGPPPTLPRGVVGSGEQRDIVAARGGPPTAFSREHTTSPSNLGAPDDDEAGVTEGHIDRTHHQNCGQGIKFNDRDVLVSAVLILGVLLRIAKRKRLKSRTQPQYRRSALIRPVWGIASTPWRRIFTYGTASDFLVSINITKSLLE